MADYTAPITYVRVPDTWNVPSGVEPSPEGILYIVPGLGYVAEENFNRGWSAWDLLGGFVSGGEPSRKAATNALVMMRGSRKENVAKVLDIMSW